MTCKLHITFLLFYLLTFTSLNSLNVAKFETKKNTFFNSQKNIVFTKVQDSAKIALQHKITKAGNDSLKIVLAYFEYGQHLDRNSQKEQSINNIKMAFKIAQQIKNDEKIAAIGNYLASTYWEVGIYEPSIAVYKTAYNSAVKTKDSSQIAKISMNLATNYNYLGDYNSAIKYALNALKVKETAKDWERICYHYVSMGVIFKETGNLEKWEHYIQKAYKMKDIENCASFADVAKIYNNLGSIAKRKEKPQTALAHFDSLLSISKKMGFNKGITAALSNSSDIYIELNQKKKALELLLEAEHYYSDPYEIISNNNSKADLYQLMGQEKKALDLVMQNIALEDLRFYSMEHVKSLTLLYELNAKLANFEEALHWNDSLRILENKLRDDKVRKGIEELETKYETQKKEQQIELLTTENELKNQRINAGIAVVLFLTILIFLILYILNIKSKQAELKQNNLRLKVLRTQMNPHFIFNALGSIQNFMMKNDARKASRYLSQFASLTRATLNNSTAETITLADEIDMIENYLELEKMRKQNKFDYTINYDENLDLDFIKIPPMLNQPFIENAIKHGFKTINKKGVLTITVTDKNNWVEFIIEDNGEGFPETVKEKGHKSMAMSIFENRRKLIKKKYKKDFKFEIINLKDKSTNKTGVRVTINIPILNND